MKAMLPNIIKIFLLLLCFGIGSTSQASTKNELHPVESNIFLLRSHLVQESAVTAVQPEKTTGCYSLSAGSLDTSNDFETYKTTSSIIKLFHLSVWYGDNSALKRIKTPLIKCIPSTFPKYLLFHQLRIPS